MQAKFDDSIMDQNQVLFLNLNREKLKNKNFRMNERIFKESLASFSTEKGEFSEEFGLYKKFKKFQDEKHISKYTQKSEVVIKGNMERNQDALQLANSNYYLEHYKQTV